MIITFSTPDFYPKNEQQCHFIDTDYSAYYQKGMNFYKLKTFIKYLIYGDYEYIIKRYYGNNQNVWIWEVIHDIEWGPGWYEDDNKEKLYEYIDTVDERATYNVIVDDNKREITLQHLKRKTAVDEYLYYDTIENLLNGWTKIRK